MSQPGPKAYHVDDCQVRDDRVVTEGSFTAEDGVELWFEVTGKGSELPLVLSHGGPGMWDYLGRLAALLDRQRMVIRWDQRGCGRSGGDGPYSVARSIADLEALRRHLGAERWIVGGHSWGASLALQAALAHPNRAAGLLYVSGTGTGRAWHPFYKAAQTDRLTPEQRARRDRLEALPSRSTDEEVEWRTLCWAPDYADRSRALELAAVDAAAPWTVNLACNAVINAETKTWIEADLLAGCRDLDVSALVIHGEADPRPPFAVDAMVAALPLVRLHVVARAGHLPWVEQPEEVAAVTLSWLGSLS